MMTEYNDNETNFNKKSSRWILLIVGVVFLAGIIIWANLPAEENAVEEHMTDLDQEQLADEFETVVDRLTEPEKETVTGNLPEFEEETITDNLPKPEEEPVADSTLENEKEPEITKLKNDGIYTLYNEETNCYLAFKERQLILSEKPSNWTLRKIKGEGFNVCAEDTGLVLDIDNAYVAVGTSIKIWESTGYDVQIWNINQNKNGTYSIVYSGDNQYCLGFDNGNAVLQIRDTMNTMQEWKLVDITDTIPKQYLSYTSKNDIIQLHLPLDVLSVISEERLQQWANDLETAYYSFYELTNYKCFDYIIVETYKPCKYVGWVRNGSNIIHIDNKFLYTDLAKMNERECDWNFCALHEMGHMFDFNRPWNFETELLTDLKLAYVLEQNGVAAAPAEFAASDNFYGADIINAYNTLGTDFSEKYNIFGCTARFLEIKEDIGWEPFKQTFHYLQANEAVYAGTTKQEKFENFVKLLSGYGNKDVRSYFSKKEWNVIINQTNS